MRIKVLGAVVGCFLSVSLCAQTDPGTNYRNFPIILTIQFHSLSLPFKNLKSNFAHIGFGIGTEVSFNGKQNLVQQLTAMWYRNKQVGNGLLFYTQSAWRPTIATDAYTEFKFGAGYLYSFRPVESYKQVNGEWVSVGHRGRGMFTVPVGASIGYNAKTSSGYVSPFLSYQFLIVNGYNKSVPILPMTLIQAGTRVHF
jgi:hypothetical protein